MDHAPSDLLGRPSATRQESRRRCRRCDAGRERRARGDAAARQAREGRARREPRSRPAGVRRPAAGDRLDRRARRRSARAPGRAGGDDRESGARGPLCRPRRARADRDQPARAGSRRRRRAGCGCACGARGRRRGGGARPPQDHQFRGRRGRLVAQPHDAGGDQRLRRLDRALEPRPERRRDRRRQRRDGARLRVRHRGPRRRPAGPGQRSAARRRSAPCGASTRARCRSQAVPVVFEPRVAGSIVRHLASAISGPAVARGTTFLKDSMGERIFAEGISIVEDPLRARRPALARVRRRGHRRAAAPADRPRRADHLAAGLRLGAPARPATDRPCGARRLVGALARARQCLCRARRRSARRI